MKENCTEADFEKEIDEVMPYSKKWISIQQSMEFTAQSSEASQKTNERHRKFKLPLLETKFFDGNVKNWLPSWGQFQKFIRILHWMIRINFSISFKGWTQEQR